MITSRASEKAETSAPGTEEAQETQDLTAAAAKVAQRIAAEPDFKTVLYKILAYCDVPRTAQEAERTIGAFPEVKKSWQSPQILLSWLIQAGGIEESMVKKGKTVWQTTPAGRIALNSASLADQLEQLIKGESTYQGIYLNILQFCLSPRSRAEIEARIRENPILEEPKVYASFFIDGLEEAGGLEWDGKWMTTQAGKRLLK